jgi:hypothetical protein
MRESDEPAAPRISTRPLKPAPVIPTTAEQYIHLPRDADGLAEALPAAL